MTGVFLDEGTGSLHGLGRKGLYDSCIIIGRHHNRPVLAFS